jgi:threonine/homoserine/homoserine lactone efflux protein
MSGHALSLAWNWHAVLGLVLAAMVVMGSPGPSTMSVMAVGAVYGVRRSLAYAFGLILGTTAVLIAVATGLAALLGSLPGLAPVLGIAAAVYILYLAFRIATAPPLPAGDPDSPAPSFSAAFLLAIANPKAYLAIASVFASSTLIGDMPILDGLLKTAVLALMIAAIHGGWLVGGAALARFLRHPVASRIAHLLFAAMLIGTVLLSLMR